MAFSLSVFTYRVFNFLLTCILQGINIGLIDPTNIGPNTNQPSTQGIMNLQHA